MVLWCDINREVTNKDVKNWFDFNNSFVTHRLTIEELIDEIKHGYSYTTVHNKTNISTKAARHADNFMFAQHFALDFDGGDGAFEPTLKNVSEIPIVKEYASFVYTTPSHTEEAPRARAVFVLSDACRSRTAYSNAVSYTNRIVGVTDQNCTDPVRVFFGSKDCDVLRLNNVVPMDIFYEWAEREEAIQTPPIVEQKIDSSLIDPSQFSKYVENAIVSEVSELANAPTGDRHMHLLKSASRLGSIMKSNWCPMGMLTTDSITGMLAAACHDNGLVNEDGNKSIIKTIHDGIINATPRDMPPTTEMKEIAKAHGQLPVSMDITKVSEMGRIYSAYRAGRLAQSLWDDISTETIEDLGIVFVKENGVVIPFIDSGYMADIATKDGEQYDYRIGVDTTMRPEQPNSDKKIAIVTKNPEDITILFDRIKKEHTPYEVIGTSEIGKVVANRLARDYDEVVFLTYGGDKNVEIARNAIKNSGMLTLQGTLREMFSWGLDRKTLGNMLEQAW